MTTFFHPLEQVEQVEPAQAQQIKMNIPRRTRREFIKEKLFNFTELIRQNSPVQTPELDHLTSLSIDSLFDFALIYLKPYERHPHILAKKICSKILINNREVEGKITRYLQCFLKFMNLDIEDAEEAKDAEGLPILAKRELNQKNNSEHIKEEEEIKRIEV